jgi:hypothetical protein
LVTPIVIRFTLCQSGFLRFQADCARFSVERGVDVDRLFPYRWNIDQAGEAYQWFDRQVDGKGVFLM